ncbi:MAG: HTH-type transcriptional regulator CysL [Stenotrophomonas maltophilia]|nr:MAG: HTH-type transcriptional regulator CysL [Stenotrophomonas maltophilia]
MNLFQLRAFDAVAREGSFTRAAERLCISQPAVTGHIKTLEEHYQVNLFRRTARGVEPTDEGLRLAAISRALFALEAEAEALLESSQALLGGRLEIAADGPHLVMPLLARLRERYPGVSVNLRLGNAQDTLAALLDERVDVALVTEVAPRPGLYLQALAQSHLCALLPAEHPWAMRPQLALAELDQQTLLLREPDSITRRTFDAACAAQGVQPQVRMELDSREAVAEAVAAELGIGIVASLETRPDPRLRSVPLDAGGLLNQHWLGCLERRRGLRVVEALFQLLAA